MELSKVVIGDKVTDGIYVLKSIKKASNGFDVLLKDKSGELICELADERFSDVISRQKGGAVKVTFIVTNGIDTKPRGIIKQIQPAGEGEFNPSDLFDGLSEEKIAEYIASIKQCMNSIPDPQCKQLCATILSEECLAQLSKLPASLNKHCKYRGGALAATAVVTKMVMQSGLQYIKGDNGLYKPALDWSTLITASLLHCVGVIDYYTSETPFTKTLVGVERGYQSVIQRYVESRIGQISISEITLARIFNIIGASVPMKSGVKATSSEGIILRQCLMLYEELDEIDAALAEHESEEGEQYFYAGHRNISLLERKAS